MSDKSWSEILAESGRVDYGLLESLLSQVSKRRVGAAMVSEADKDLFRGVYYALAEVFSMLLSDQRKLDRNGSISNAQKPHKRIRGGGKSADSLEDPLLTKALEVYDRFAALVVYDSTESAEKLCAALVQNADIVCGKAIGLKRIRSLVDRLLRRDHGESSSVLAAINQRLRNEVGKRDHAQVDFIDVTLRSILSVIKEHSTEYLCVSRCLAGISFESLYASFDWILNVEKSMGKSQAVQKSVKSGSISNVASEIRHAASTMNQTAIPVVALKEHMQRIKLSLADIIRLSVESSTCDDDLEVCYDIFISSKAPVEAAGLLSSSEFAALLLTKCCKLNSCDMILTALGQTNDTGSRNAIFGQAILDARTALFYPSVLALFVDSPTCEQCGKILASQGFLKEAAISLCNLRTRNPKAKLSSPFINELAASVGWTVSVSDKPSDTSRNPLDESLESNERTLDLRALLDSSR